MHVVVRRFHQRAPAQSVGGVHVRAGIDQRLHDLEPTRMRRPHQRSGAVGVAGIAICAGGEKFPHARGIARFDRLPELFGHRDLPSVLDPRDRDLPSPFAAQPFQQGAMGEDPGDRGDDGRKDQRTELERECNRLALPGDEARL